MCVFFMVCFRRVLFFCFVLNLFGGRGWFGLVLLLDSVFLLLFALFCILQK